MPVFHISVSWRYFSLSDSKSPQVSRTLLSILANLSNAVVWMVSIRLLISDSTRPFSRLLKTVSNALDKISISLTFLFLCFFCSLVRSNYLFILSLSFIFTMQSAGIAKSRRRQIVFFFYQFTFLLTNTKSGLHVRIRWSVYISKSQRISWVSFSPTNSRLCEHYLVVLLHIHN